MFKVKFLFTQTLKVICFNGIFAEFWSENALRDVIKPNVNV